MKNDKFNVKVETETDGPTWLSVTHNGHQWAAIMFENPKEEIPRAIAVLQMRLKGQTKMICPKCTHSAYIGQFTKDNAAFEKDNTRKAITMMKKAPTDWEKAVAGLSTKEIEDLRNEVEVLGRCAAILAGYLDQRYDYDLGHENAVKAINRSGKMGWWNSFGYSGDYEIDI